MRLTEIQAAAEALVLKASIQQQDGDLRPPTSVLCGPGGYQLVPAIHACIAKYETLHNWRWPQSVGCYPREQHRRYPHPRRGKLDDLSHCCWGGILVQNNKPITFRDFCLAIWAHFGHAQPLKIHIPEGWPILQDLCVK